MKNLNFFLLRGVPLYLEHIRPDFPAEQNIRELCFTKGGLFVREFEEIFSDFFSAVCKPQGIITV